MAISRKRPSRSILRATSSEPRYVAARETIGAPAMRGCGIVFALPAAGGCTNYTVLHDFQEKVSKKKPDGAKPEGSLRWNAADGFLYGATREGGDAVCDSGTIYKVKP